MKNFDVCVTCGMKRDSSWIVGDMGKMSVVWSRMDSYPHRGGIVASRRWGYVKAVEGKLEDLRGLEWWDWLPKVVPVANRRRPLEVDRGKDHKSL